MSILDAAFARIRNAFRKDLLDRELDAELASHLEMHIEDNLRAGMTPEAARRDALLKLGGIEQTKENHRDSRGLPFVETLVRDIRFGVRLLRNSPGFTASAVVTLALGIGANAAIFSFVNAALLRPLPYRSPQNLIVLSEGRGSIGSDGLDASLPDFQDWQRSSKTIESFAAFNSDRVALSGAGNAENLDVARTTTNFFSTLGVAPIMGRDFLPKEDQAGGAKIVMLTFPFWKSRFGGATDVVGKTLRLDGIAHTIVGVLPNGFEFAPAGSPALWLPLNLSAEFAARRNLRWLKIVGRLAPGVSQAQAASEMQTINAALAAAHPQENAAIKVHVRSLRELIVGNIRPLFLVLSVAVAFVLLMACANVAHLMLARATTRKKEIAVRVALGATRLQIVRQLLTESALLSVAGGILGVIVAHWGVSLLLAVVPENVRKSMPFLSSIHLDFSTFGFLLASTLITSIAFGFLPAWQLSKSDPNETLKEESRGATGTRGVWLRNGLVIGELAISIVLLTGAGLMVRSLNAVMRQNPGFDVNNLVSFSLSLPETAYQDEASALQFRHRLEAQLTRLPGVSGAASVNYLPVTGLGNTVRFVQEGHPKPNGSEDEGAIRDVSPNYFSIMKIPVNQGRIFLPSDDTKAPGRLVVNQAFADRFLSGENAVGKRLKFTYSDNLPYMEIIGVVANENSQGLDTPMDPIIYASMDQGPDSGFFVVMRTSADPSTTLTAARDALHDIDPELAMISPRTMDAVISDSYAVFLRRFPSRLISGFALIAMMLAAVGLYGQISYGVAQRRREIGVRVAMGASTGNVLRMVVANGMVLTAAGLFIGFAGSLLLTGLLVSLLFGVTPLDPLTMAVSALLLMVVSIVASLVPARRATLIDPVVALRYE
jgi:predicted permease